LWLELVKEGASSLLFFMSLWLKNNITLTPTELENA